VYELELDKFKDKIKFLDGKTAFEVGSQLIEIQLSAKKPIWFLTVNLELVSRYYESPQYKTLIMKNSFACADGWPIALYLSITCQSRVRKISGVDLTYSILNDFPSISSVFIIGGYSLENLKTQNNIKLTHFSELIDIQDSQFASNLIDKIKTERPQVILVALGMPKQDELACLFVERLDYNPIIIGVGGSIDFLTHFKKRSPVFVRLIGMEWLYRLWSEPRRLWKRYLVMYPVGALKFLLSRFC